MTFKKFSQFIAESKKPDKKDIEEASVPKPDAAPDANLACPKCGSSSLPCECYTDDYYNAKISQQTPNPNTVIKPKKKSNE